MLRNRVALGILVAPVVGVATGVLAERTDLNPPLLLSIAVPALLLSTLAAASLLRARPVAVILTGAALGLLTFTLSAGVYLAVHYARGGSQDTPAVFFGVHVGVGMIVGLAVGSGVAFVMAMSRSLRQRRLATEP